MKHYTLLFITIFFAIQSQAQVGTNFEEPTGTGTDDYISPTLTAHTLSNNAGQPAVTHTYSGGEIGFTSTFTPSRTGTPGIQGLSDGDAVGVHTNAGVIASTDASSWSSGQAYIIEDPDGMITIAFDAIDLISTSNPVFSMDLWIDATTYENTNGANDRVYIRLEIDGGASVIDVYDTDGGGTGGGGGGDIDALGIEETVINLSQNLSAHIGSTVQLIIEADFDSGSEKCIIDNINFTEGTVVTGGLPITLLDFQAKRINEEEVSLDWATASEKDNAGFEIEQSLDGVKFEKVAFVDGAGNSSEIRQYSHTVVQKEAIYYRIKQVDFDGSFSYSPIRFVKSLDVQNQPILYPNPTSGKIYIENIDDKENMRISILSTKGKEVARFSGKKAEVETQMSQRLTGGVYH